MKKYNFEFTKIFLNDSNKEVIKTEISGTGFTAKELEKLLKEAIKIVKKILDNEKTN